MKSSERCGRPCVRSFTIPVLVMLILQACAINGALAPESGTVDIEIAIIRFVGSGGAVDRVTVDVVDAGRDPAHGSGQVLVGSGGVYRGTLTNLTVGEPLRVTGHAFDTSGREIFSGSAAVTLTASESSLTLLLVPIDDGQPVDVPIIRQVVLPETFRPGGAATVTIETGNGSGGPLVYSIAPAASFSPSEGTVVTNSAGEGTVTSRYRAPLLPGTYTGTATVTDGLDTTVETDFDAIVTGTPAGTGFRVRYAPTVTALKAKRVGSEVLWAVGVAGDGPASELVYSWRLDGVEFSTQNPGILSGYTEALSGTVTLEVTDGFGLGDRTSVRLALAADRFPEDPADPDPDVGYDLYLLIGQSNMVGRAPIEDIPDRVPHPRVFQLTRDKNWVPAADPLEHNDFHEIRVGPGLTFAKTMASVDPDVQIGLIPAARGGTSITEWMRGMELYDDAVARVLEAVANGDGRIRGVLWHQGESDSVEKADAEAYAGRLATLVGHLREDLGAPNLPFVCGNLYQELEWWYRYSHIVDAALTDLPNQVANTYCASSTGLSDKGDNLHFDTASQRELGLRMARGMLGLLD